ncbi:MAG: hypothetical protein WAO69_12210 [Aestuariivita sp.]|uniref:hypothetical protein n=1 Tax=Aestuariivita sp. TaxID=1872407 RepID=UPI003BB01177
MATSSLTRSVAIRCRDVASALLGGLWPGRDSNEVAAQIADLPYRLQVAFTLGALTLLALVSFFAAQFGLIGIAIFWLGVIALIA